MKRRTRVVLSVISGVAAAAIAFLYVSSVRAEAERMQREALQRYGGELVNVCVATRDIDPGETLDETNVVVEEWVAALLPPDAAASLREVVGKTATSRIPKRAVLCPVYTEPREPALDTPSGLVAVSVAVDEAHAVGGALEGGDEVDVYVSKDAVANRLGSAVVIETSVEATDGGKLAWVTIGVKPEAVSEVLAATTSGAVTLVAPRASGDSQRKGE